MLIRMFLSIGVSRARSLVNWLSKYWVSSGWRYEKRFLKDIELAASQTDLRLEVWTEVQLRVAPAAPSLFRRRRDGTWRRRPHILLILTEWWRPSLTALANILALHLTNIAGTMEFHYRSTRTVHLHHNPRKDFDRWAFRKVTLRTTTNRPTDCSADPANYRKFHPEWTETFQTKIQRSTKLQILL